MLHSHKSTVCFWSNSRSKLTITVVPLFFGLLKVLTKCFQRKPAKGFMSQWLIFIFRDVKCLLGSARFCFTTYAPGWEAEGLILCQVTNVLTVHLSMTLHIFSLTNTQVVHNPPLQTSSETNFKTSSTSIMHSIIIINTCWQCGKDNRPQVSWRNISG